MPLKCRKICRLAAGVLLLASCAAPREEGKAAAVAPEEQWSCFNGCAIVLVDGHYGLIREEDGAVLVPARYSAIEFLDDETALLTDGTAGSLCDRNGRILCEEESADSLRLHYTARVEAVRETDRRSWEQVLSDYERLCRLCKESHGETVSRKKWKQLKAAERQVEESLESATGKPTPSQKARLEAVSNDYRRAFR